MMDETAHERIERVGKNYAFVTLTSYIFSYVHFSMCNCREIPNHGAVSQPCSFRPS